MKTGENGGNGKAVKVMVKMLPVGNLLVTKRLKFQARELFTQLISIASEH